MNGPFSSETVLEETDLKVCRTAEISGKVLSKHHPGRLNSFNVILNKGNGREKLP